MAAGARAESSLAAELDRRTVEGAVCETGEKGWVRCLACGHACRIPPGARGVCKVRFNDGGRLKVPWGYVAGRQCDPIEKKPFFHVHPGSLAYSFGMLGCDLHCGYCQNWVTSQALRDASAVSPPEDTSPDDLVEEATALGARIVVSTYNEPLITSEWARAVFVEARSAGLMTAFVSNGNATTRALDYLVPWLDGYKVDLKSFDDRHYRTLGGRLEPILESITDLHRRGVWLEIVTLLVPGFNDSPAELTRLTEFIAGVSREIPWHVTAFHSDYRMADTRDTSADALVQAAAIGRRAGLVHVYAGNRPGAVGALEHTWCSACGSLLVAREGYRINDYRITPAGRCPACAQPVPGRWADRFEGQRTERPFVPLFLSR